MRGYFDTPLADKWRFVGATTITLVVVCELPALIPTLFLYELEANEHEGVYYARAFIAWEPRPFSLICRELYEVSGACNIRARALVSERASRAEFDSAGVQMDLTRPGVYAWKHFRLLELARLMTGRWHEHPAPVLAAFKAGEFTALAYRHAVKLRPGWVYARTDSFEAAEIVRVLNFITDQTCERGLVVPHAALVAGLLQNKHTMPAIRALLDKGLLVKRDDGALALKWAHALAEQFQRTFARAEFCEREPVGAFSVFPEISPATVVRNAHAVPLRKLLKHTWPKDARIIAVGSLDAPGDAWVLKGDAPLTAARLCGVIAAPEPREKPVCDFQHLARRGRRKGTIALFPERSVDRRIEQLAELFGDDKAPRVLYVFAYEDPARRRFEGGRRVNWLCTRATEDCKPGAVCLLRWPEFKSDGPKRQNRGPLFTHRGKSVKFLGDSFRPLLVCRESFLIELEPDDFEYVVFFGDAGTSPRWIHEAKRVGANGLTIFYGIDRV